MSDWPESNTTRPIGDPRSTEDRMRVAFLVNDLQLSGGVGVVVQHAHRLSSRHGWDVTLVLVRQDDDPSWHGYDHLPHLHVRTRTEALGERYDVAIATWWETTFTLFELDADRYAYFAQSLEDRFYRRGQPERIGAALSLDLPVSFITEAGWIVETLSGLRPDTSCHLVPNGVDKDVFSPPATVASSAEEPLRILVEGSPHVWFKHVLESVQAVAEMNEPHHLTVVCGDRAALEGVAADEVLGPLSHREMAELYRRTDVVLKLSSVEGVSGPPLEGFHCGATCVVTPVTGHDEYVRHGFNGLLADWDDLRGTARQLDLLARDRELLTFLRRNAVDTARAWPGWNQSNQAMADALLSIRKQPPPTGPIASARLTSDLRSAIEIYDFEVRAIERLARRALRLQRPIDWVRQNRLTRRLLMLRRNRVMRIVLRPARPLYRRLRHALS